MARYALINNGVFQEFRELDAVPVLPGKPQYRFLPVVDVRPSHDPATQVLTGPVNTIHPDRYERVWTVVNKTAQELDADREGEFASIDDRTKRLLFNMANEIRVLKGQAPFTPAQFRNYVKNLGPIA